MHALLDALGRAPADRQQFDAEAELARIFEIHRRDVADAGDRDRVEIHRRAEGEAGQDGQLVRGVDAVHVEARIGLGIAHLLRVGEHVGEAPPALAHHGEDVVAGAVQDAVDAQNLVSGEAFAQRLDDRDAAGHRRLVAERDTGALRRRRERGAMMREHRLVGGNDMALLRERGFGQRLGRPIGAANQFDDRVGLGAPRHLDGIVEPRELRNVDVALLVAVARGDGRDDEAPPAARFEQSRLARE